MLYILKSNAQMLPLTGFSKYTIETLQNLTFDRTRTFHSNLH